MSEPTDAPVVGASVVTNVAPVLHETDPCSLNRMVIRGLLYTLGACLFYVVGLGALSWWQPAADGAGVNTATDMVKTAFTFVLGALSGFVQARIIGGHHGATK